MAEEIEGNYSSTENTMNGDCEYELLTKIAINEDQPKNSKLHIHCRHIPLRIVFEDFFTPNELQKAGFVGIRSHKQLDKAKNLIDTAFTSSDEEISMDIQIINYSQVEQFLTATDEDEDENENDVDQIDDDDEKKDQMTDTEDKDMEEEVLAIHIIKDDHFMLLECKLILKPIPRKETEILREIIEEMEHRLMPIGSIIMWSGNANKIPIGWALCNGQNGTPDLRDRFIVGAGGKYTTGEIGGNDQHNHSVTVNPHVLTINEIPSHNHLYTAWKRGMNSQWNGANDKYQLCSRDKETDVSQSTGSNAAHSHASNCDLKCHLPPYFALCFLMLKDPLKY